MHPESFRFVAEAVRDMGQPRSVLEIGSRDVNGSVRRLFREAERYVGIDLHAGPGVDVVGDARDYMPDEPFDCVVCLSTLEHAEDWAGLVSAMARALQPGGVALISAPVDPWPPHSGIDGGRLRPGEHYRNVEPEAFVELLEGYFVAISWHMRTLRSGWREFYAVARKAGTGAAFRPATRHRATRHTATRRVRERGTIMAGYVTCATCHRVLNEGDADADGNCVNCRSTPDAGRATRPSRARLALGQSRWRAREAEMVEARAEADAEAETDDPGVEDAE